MNLDGICITFKVTKNFLYLKKEFVGDAKSKIKIDFFEIVVKTLLFDQEFPQIMHSLQNPFHPF